MAALRGVDLAGETKFKTNARKEETKEGTKDTKETKETRRQKKNKERENKA